jgi:hypothetical protein
LRQSVRSLDIQLRELRRGDRLHRLQRFERQSLLVVDSITVQLVRGTRPLDRRACEGQLLADTSNARVVAPHFRRDRVVKLVAFQRRAP